MSSLTPLYTIDFAILNFIQSHMTSPLLDSIMVFITTLGNYGFLWILLSLILLALPQGRKAGLASCFALGLGTLIAILGVKNLVARPRPFHLQEFALLIASPSGFSFPSGHTLSSFASATAIFRFHKKTGIAALILAALIGFSRLYLYVHFPSDVLVGAVLGVLFGLMGAELSKAVSKKLPKLFSET